MGGFILTLRPETKVGIFALVALVAMISLFLWLSGTQLLERGYTKEVVFDRIEGLRPGAPVKYIGVDVGRITEIGFEDQKIIVTIRIQRQFKITERNKALIAASSVVGDKYLELVPLGSTEKPLPDGRIAGIVPVSMDQLYYQAYEVITSLNEITASLKTLTNDPQVMNSFKNSLANLERITTKFDGFSNQLGALDVAGLFQRLDRIATTAERIVQGNEAQLGEFVRNINQASVQLAQATLTANEFLQKADAGGELGSNLKQTVANAQQITANLEKFTQVLAANDQNIDRILDDAHQAMTAITEAAQNINNAVLQLTAGDGTDANNSGNLNQVKETISLANQAVKKVNTYVQRLEQFTFRNSAGVGYHSDDELFFNYRFDSTFNDKSGLWFQLDDLGAENRTTVQYTYKSANFISRAGVYQNKFGVGFDYPANSHWTVGLNLWDTDNTRFGLSSAVRFNDQWSLSLDASKPVDTGKKDEDSWDFVLWKKF